MWKLVFSFDFVSPYRFHSFPLVPFDTHISLFFSLCLRRSRVLLSFFSAKESGTNWLTSTQMALAWTDRGVTVLSTARLCGGSRGDRGESPKISRSRTTAVYRPTKYDLYAIAVHWIAHRAISEYLIIHRLQTSSHLVSRVWEYHCTSCIQISCRRRLLFYTTNKVPASTVSNQYIYFTNKSNIFTYFSRFLCSFSGTKKSENKWFISKSFNAD